MVDLSPISIVTFKTIAMWLQKVKYDAEEMPGQTQNLSSRLRTKGSQVRQLVSPAGETRTGGSQSRQTEELQG